MGSSDRRASVVVLSLVAVLGMVFESEVCGSSSCYVYPPNRRDPCEDKRCNFGARCVPSLDGSTARCQCQEQCQNYGDSVGSWPLCATDGRDYENQCSMEREACITLRNIAKKYDGECDPCSKHTCSRGQLCLLDESRRPTCQCNSTCPQLQVPIQVSPVCGTDGRTYAHACRLLLESCRNDLDIGVLKEGECTKDEQTCGGRNCSRNQRCKISPTEEEEEEGEEEEAEERLGTEETSKTTKKKKKTKRKAEFACRCPWSCRKVMKPVCSSDGRSFDNECALRSRSCLENNPDLTVKYFGLCDVHSPCLTFVCGFGATCDSTYEHPACLCYDNCTLEYKPVCGSNGVTYENQCQMEMEGCHKRIIIRRISHGPCNGCEARRCDFYSICENSINSRQVRCVCPSSCVQVKDTVCGSDHVTYLNECELKVTSCRQRKVLTVLHGGPCRDCDQIGRCPPGLSEEEEKEGRGGTGGGETCPRCPRTRDPVCSSDDVTYTNECHLTRKVCLTGRSDLRLVHAGRCRGPNSTADEECTTANCRFGGVCLRNGLGHTECSCQVPCKNRTLSPVCGSDGRTYLSECHMNDESCSRQENIWLVSQGPCAGDQMRLCGDSPPLVNPSSGTYITCRSHLDECPPGGYCFNSIGGGVCCDAAKFNSTCQRSKFGCCSDGVTLALGLQKAGCPETCRCKAIGSYGRSCDPVTGQCTCKPGVGGLHCDRCEANYWGLNRVAEGNTGCLPCACHVFGSVREDCEQTAGRCSCKAHVTGVKCDSCSNGVQLSVHGCSGPFDAAQVNITDPGDHCESVSCRFNAICQNLGPSRTAGCVCPTGCTAAEPASSGRVCGTDGVTYSSSCFLKVTSCRLQKEVQIYHYGPCLGLLYEFCSSDEECVVQGATCRVERCRCGTGLKQFNSSTCIKDSKVPMFTGQSYAKYKLADSPGLDMTLVIVFRPTRETNGILLYLGGNSTDKGDYAVVFVKHGRCHFKYDLGSGSTALHSIDRVKLHSRHRLIVFRSKKSSWIGLERVHPLRSFEYDADLLMEPQKKTFGTSPGDLYALNSEGYFFVGHAPTAGESFMKSLGVSSGFAGCIELVWLKSSDAGTRYDLTSANQPLRLEEQETEECQSFPCDLEPCSHNSTCIHISSVNFHCICPEGYAGENCQESNPQDLCQSSPCLNQGECRNDTKSGRTQCSCKPGWHGELCSERSPNDRDTITIPEFNGASYLALTLSKSISQSFSFEIWFLSRKPDGCLLFGRQDDGGDFFSLQLVSGFVQLQFHLGTSLANITSLVPVNLNTWNRVSIFRMNQFGSLTLNDMETVKGHSNDPLKELNLPQFVYLGGYRWSMTGSFGAHMRHVTRTGLDGVVQRFYENGEHLSDLMERSVDHEMLVQYNGPPCPTGRNPCLHGAGCRPRLGSFSCDCPFNYTGSICNQEINKLHEDRRPLLFDGRSCHVYKNRIFRREKSQSTNKYHLRFRTTSPDGLLLLQKSRSSTESDFLAVALNEGHLEVTLNLGKERSDRPFALRYEASVFDYQWHQLLLHRNRRLVTLTVDDSDSPVVALAAPGAAHLDTDGLLYVGCGDVPKGLPDSYHHGFNGCLLDVSLNDEPLNLLMHRHFHTDVKFCS